MENIFFIRKSLRSWCWCLVVSIRALVAILQVVKTGETRWARACIAYKHTAFTSLWLFSLNTANIMQTYVLSIIAVLLYPTQSSRRQTNAHPPTAYIIVFMLWITFICAGRWIHTTTTHSNIRTTYFSITKHTDNADNIFQPRNGKGNFLVSWFELTSSLYYACRHSCLNFSTQRLAYIRTSRLYSFCGLIG